MKRYFIIVVIGSLCICCSKTNSSETSTFLKVKNIQLVAPRLNVPSTIIDSFVTLTANLKMKDAELFYTTNGEEPTKQSELYTQPLKIKTARTYTFKAFHPDWKASQSTTLKTYKKGDIPKNINWITKANNQYPSVGSKSLINHKKATLNFRDQQWMGFDTTAIASIKFEKEIAIKKLTIGYLIDTKSWIFPPETVTLHFSPTDSIKVNVPKIESTLNLLNDIEIPIHRNIKQLKIKVTNLKRLPNWHSGNGSKAWLFMDEWIFN